MKMRKRFSERYGHSPVKDRFQIESVDDGLKSRLWNVIQKYYLDKILKDMGHIKYQRDKDFFDQIYDEFFKSHERISTFLSSLNDDIKKRYLHFEWFSIYDFIEYLPSIFYNDSYNEEFRHTVNRVLESEMSGYRFVDRYIAPIIDEKQIEEIEKAISNKFEGVSRHLANALEHLSDRENPDYITSIKESISAVEALCQILVGNKQDLGSCLKKLDLDINKQFRNGMSTLYDWTCQEDGIRHAHTKEEIKSSFEEANYMLVTCSAFINYVVAKNNQKT